MIILAPLAIAAAPTIGGTAGAGTGAANLLSPDPKEVWAAGTAGTTTIDVDVGSARDVDSFFLGFTNAAAAATWSVQSATGPGLGLVDLVPTTGFRAADSAGPRHHGFVRIAAPAATRYLRLTVTQPDAALQAGILLVGKGLSGPYEFGSGRAPIDTGTKEMLIGGGFGIADGVVKAQLRWTFPDLSPADRRALWALVSDRGETRPVLVVEETGEGAGLNEELHYGLFDRLQAYERLSPGTTRWALSMTEWQ